MGAPDSLVFKTPSADLECLSPQKEDEQVLGVSYENIDNFLEGRDVAADIAERLISIYTKTQHKRLPIATIYDWHQRPILTAGKAPQHSSQKRDWISKTATLSAIYKLSLS